MKKIFLRFRDTDTNDTIASHNEIIESKGKVWWGWWKKVNEPAKTEVLESAAENTENTEVLLFDRATDRYYAAKLLELVWVPDGLNITCPDKLACPSYYRDAELPAWFSFGSITEVTKDYFLDKSKGFPSSNYTLFSEADSTTFDNKDRIKLKSNNILHISDIHFGADHGFPHKSSPNNKSLIDIIRDYINYEFEGEIGLLIVSGDITSRADANVFFSTGNPFLNELVKILDISKEAVVIIPGNHDIPLNDANFHNYRHEEAFGIFLEQFYEQKKELYGIEYFELPNGENLDVLRINSVRLRKKDESQYGYVEISLYTEFLREMRRSSNMKIAVMHHHLVSMPIEENLDTSYPYGSISVTIDSGRVIEGLHGAGIKFVLNGHQHISGITKIARGIINSSNEIDSLDNDLFILSAGSAGAKPDRLGEHMKYNSFSVYTIIDSKQILVNSQQYNTSKEPWKYFNATLRI